MIASASVRRPSASVLLISTVLPFIDAKHVAELVGLARRHVLGAGGERVDLDGELLFGDSDDGRQHSRGAGHVGLHVHHALVGLERQPARVEGHALADQDDALGGVRRGLR